MRDLGSHGFEKRPIGHIGPGGHWEVTVVRETHHLFLHHDDDQDDEDDQNDNDDQDDDGHDDDQDDDACPTLLVLVSMRPLVLRADVVLKDTLLERFQFFFNSELF